MIRHIAGSNPILLSDRPHELLEFLRVRGIPRRRGDLRQLLAGDLVSVRLTGQEAYRVGGALAGLPRISWRQVFEQMTVTFLCRRLTSRAQFRRKVR